MSINASIRAAIADRVMCKRAYAETDAPTRLAGALVGAMGGRSIGNAVGNYAGSHTNGVGKAFSFLGKKLPLANGNNTGGVIGAYAGGMLGEAVAPAVVDGVGSALEKGKAMLDAHPEVGQTLRGLTDRVMSRPHQVQPQQAPSLQQVQPPQSPYGNKEASASASPISRMFEDPLGRAMGRIGRGSAGGRATTPLTGVGGGIPVPPTGITGNSNVYQLPRRFPRDSVQDMIRSYRKSPGITGNRNVDQLPRRLPRDSFQDMIRSYRKQSGIPTEADGQIHNTVPRSTLVPRTPPSSLDKEMMDKYMRQMPRLFSQRPRPETALL